MPSSLATRTGTCCLSLALSTALLAGCSDDESTSQASGSTPSASETVPVLQPGKPGEPNTTLSGSATSPEAEKIHPADVTFMQDMIVHHGQAVVMVDIVDGKLTDPAVAKLATRIGTEQKPEMGFVRKWLTERDQKVPATGDSPDEHGSSHHDHEDMPGMATPAQLNRLRAAKGPAKDVLFLDLMIKHHRGALIMVDDLAKAGGGRDTDVDKFSGDVYAVQSAQIRSMNTMRARLKGDTTESAPAPPTT